MKKTVLLALSLLAMLSCNKFDDSAIWEELDKHEDRIVKLETLCNQMNTNISSLQTIIIALQSNDYVVNIAPIKEGDKEIGYTITFANSGSITIYHGSDGKNGQDGVDGKDGQDGYTPIISVKQHKDGKYYWTLDGNWLLDDSGNMIPTTGEDGTDGKDGQNGADGKDGQNGKDGEDGEDGTDGKDGKDGITPQLKIEDGYWYLSYDNGVSWQNLGKATGNNGLDGANGADGADGDNIIDSITQDDEFVIFTLSDGKVFKIAKYNSDIIQFADYRVKMLCVSNWDTDNDFEISKTEAANVETIGTVFSGDTDIFLFNELQYFTGITEIEDDAFSKCESLISIYIPDNVRTIGVRAFWKCNKLKNISFGETAKLLAINGGVVTTTTNGISKVEASGAFAYCTSLEKISIPSSLQVIGVGAFYNCSALETVEFCEESSLVAIESNNVSYKSDNSCTAFGAFSKTGLKSVIIPASVTNIGGGVFSHSDLEEVKFEEGIQLTVLNSITSNYYIGVFSDCINLKTIEIPKSVTEIMPSVFEGCTALERVTFEPGSQLKIIGGLDDNTEDDSSHGAFMNCTSLTNIVMPPSVTTLGSGAFEGCTKLKYVEFEGPSEISYIKGSKCRHSAGYGCPTYSGAFMGCTALEEIKIAKSTPPSLSEYAFRNLTMENITVKVPYGSADAYKATSYWKNMTIKEFYE